MEPCKDLGELLSARVDGELDRVEESRVEAHLEGCEACAGRFDALDRAAGLVGTMEPPAGGLASEEFLRRLDERLEVELRVDGLIREPSKPWRSGRLAAARVQRLARVQTLLRIAALVLVCGLAAWAYRVASRAPDAKVGEGKRVDTPAPSRPEDGGRKAPAPPAPAGPGAVAARPVEDGGGPEEESDPLEPGAPPPPGVMPREELVKAPAVQPESPEVRTERLAGPSEREVEDPVERERRAERLARAFLNPRRARAEREEYLYELVSLGGPRAAAVLRQILVERKHPTFVEDAARAVRTFPSPEGLYALLEHAERAPRRDPAATAAAAVRARRALVLGTKPDLLAWLAGEVLPKLREGEARALVAEALGARARDAGEGAGPAIAAALERTQRPALRVRLVAALGEAGREAPGPVLPALREAVGDRDEAVRAAAALALGTVARAEADADAQADLARLVERLREDPHPLVRAAAARALPAFGGEAAVDALVAALERKGEGARVRGAALLALHRATGEGLFAASDWRDWWGRSRGRAALPEPGAGPPLVLVSPAPAESYRGIPILSDGVVFLIDASQSMAPEARFDLARRELERALRALPPGTPFAVATFGAGTQFADARGLVRASPQTVDQAIAFVSARRAEGPRRDVDDALEAALRLPQADTVVLISDGAPADSGIERTLEAVRRLNWQGGVRIHAVGCFGGLGGFAVDRGVGGPEPVEFLRRLARENGGVFVHD